MQDIWVYRKGPPYGELCDRYIHFPGPEKSRERVFIGHYMVPDERSAGVRLAVEQHTSDDRMLREAIDYILAGGSHPDCAKTV